jgi:putative ABC transport system permease protein
MQAIELNLKEGINSLRLNPLRSFLAMLGVVIGVAAVITVISFGEGHSRRIQQEIDKIGADVFWIRPKRQAVNPEEMEKQPLFFLQTLKYADLKALTFYNTKIICSAGLNQFFTSVLYNDQQIESNIIATEPAYAKILKLESIMGRFLSQADFKESRKVCVIEYSDYLRKYLSQKNPLESFVVIENIKFRVIGLLNKKKESLRPSFQGNIYIPLSAQKYFFSDNFLETIYFQTSRKNVKKAMKNAEEIMKSRHKGENLLECVNAEKLFKSAEKLTRTASLVTAGIAMISLIVGSIGIMNIMLVSVTERTREIGLRKCVGAKNKNIRNQFLIEASLLTTIGGGMGIGFGFFLAKFISSIIDIPVVFSLIASIIGFVFSVSIGIITGLYPAYKASKLNPIEALRYE